MRSALLQPTAFQRVRPRIACPDGADAGEGGKAVVRGCCTQVHVLAHVLSSTVVVATTYMLVLESTTRTAVVILEYDCSYSEYDCTGTISSTVQ